MPESQTTILLAALVLLAGCQPQPNSTDKAIFVCEAKGMGTAVLTWKKPDENQSWWHLTDVECKS